ncbi:hypothetical protein J3Q64DRAFT_1835289 [Phycomyces blakesleeanus]|uniref:Uncharacterized protein n=1 Tax=Phycomyces blakesleeanus TaxID=4837 RepID=A0ABR3AZ23_PHYBL
MSILPASLNNIQYAIHFGLLEFMRDMRDVLAISGQGLADLYNKINLGAETDLKGVLPESSPYLHQAKVEKLSSGFQESSCCTACPDVDSNVAVEDCQFVATDGNFSLKCERKKGGEGDVGEKLEQVEAQLKQVWIGDGVVGRFDSNFHGDLLESGRKVQGNIALFLVKFTLLRRLREFANDANGNHVKDEINRLKHEMEKLKTKIQEEVEGFQEPDEENTNLIKYIEENAQLGYNEFLAYKKNSKMRLEPMFERIMIPRHCSTNLAISAKQITYLLQAFNLEFNESLTFDSIINKKNIFWDAEIRPEVHLFLAKKRAEEEVALLKHDAFWLQHRATKERTLREQGLKALDNAVGTLDKEVLCGMQFLLARKLRLSVSWERAVFAQTSFHLGSFYFNKHNINFDLSKHG